MPDIDFGVADESDYLTNTDVESISWKDVAVSTSLRTAKQQRVLVDNQDGVVQAGEFSNLLVVASELLTNPR